MKTSKKIILIALGTVGLSVLTIAAIITYFYIALSIGLSSHYLGDAPEEDRIEFEEYYEDFERVNDFIIEDYDVNRQSKESQYYNIDTNKGEIEVSIPNDIDGDATKMLPLKVNSDLKKSVKRLKGYDENFDAAYVREDCVDYDVGSSLVYTRDGSVPTYMYEPDESDHIFAIYKFRDSWYHIFIP